jgi:hypothetical protein
LAAVGCRLQRLNVCGDMHGFDIGEFAVAVLLDPGE